MVWRVARALLGIVIVLVGVGPSDVLQNLQDWANFFRDRAVHAPGLPSPDFDWVLIVIGTLVVLTSVFDPQGQSRRLGKLVRRWDVRRMTVPLIGTKPVTTGAYVDEPKSGSRVPCIFTIRGRAATFEGNVIVQRHIEGDEWKLVAAPVTSDSSKSFTNRPFSVRLVLPKGEHLLRVGDSSPRDGLFDGMLLSVRVEPSVDGPSSPVILGKQMSQVTVSGLRRRGALDKIPVDVMALLEEIGTYGGRRSRTGLSVLSLGRTLGEVIAQGVELGIWTEDYELNVYDVRQGEWWISLTDDGRLLYVAASSDLRLSIGRSMRHP